MPKEPDELGLQQAELVIVLQKEEGEAYACIITSLTFGATSNPDVQSDVLHDSNLKRFVSLAWCYGERMRDGVKGWFPASCATEITNPTAMENNVQRMKRLRKETNVWGTINGYMLWVDKPENTFL